jgi:hypothetical protein
MHITYAHFRSSCFRVLPGFGRTESTSNVAASTTSDKQYEDDSPGCHSNFAYAILNLI